MKSTVKIFGERNTSTNALEQLIQNNSKSRIAPSSAKDLDPRVVKRLAIAKKLRLPMSFRERMIDRVFEGRNALEAWKHTTTDFEDIQCFEGCHVVFCVRHPASWLVGLFRRPHNIHGLRSKSLHGFLDESWKTVGRERLGRIEATAAAVYNIKVAAYADLQRRLESVNATYSVVRHEDFAVDQNAVFTRLEPFLLEPSKTFRPLNASTKDKSKSAEYYRDYYGRQLWRNAIDERSSARIKELINWSAVEDYDYAWD